MNLSSAGASSTSTTTTGNGTFQAMQAFGTGTSPLWIAVGDFNGDGKSDLVTADYTADTASVLLGNGVWYFSGQTDIQPRTSTFRSCGGRFKRRRGERPGDG